ncbi:MAG TPA: DUF420 domain-containing protein [Opitutales bacterium]|nr:DUF420 domain-containing protein [Opitutales bacterium]
MNLEFFPPLNAALNGLSLLFLTGGFYFIRFRRDQQSHRKCMIAAFTISILFMISYLTYHTLKEGVHTRFGGSGFLLYLYYGILLSHIVLAMVNLPLILITMRLAIKRRFKSHQKWAKWTFPIWYYVSVTGVLVYFFLYQWFPGERI